MITLECRILTLKVGLVSLASEESGYRLTREMLFHSTLQAVSDVVPSAPYSITFCHLVWLFSTWKCCRPHTVYV